MEAVTFLGLLVAVAVTDLRSRAIPNTLIVFGVLILMISSFFSSLHALPLGTPVVALAGIAIALLLTVPGWFSAKLGGGDVKLSLLLGAALGPLGFLWSVVLAVPFGLVFAVLYRIRGKPIPEDLPAGAFLSGGAGIVVVGATWPLAWPTQPALCHFS